MQQEWGRFRSRKAWDESTPREREDVAKEARATKEEVHFGMGFGFVVEKNTDLPAGDPRRKFKGRVVFQGSKVKNQNWENAVFADLGSSPSSMEAGRLVDAFGLRPNYYIQQSTQPKPIYRRRSEANLHGIYCLVTNGQQHGDI